MNPSPELQPQRQKSRRRRRRRRPCREISLLSLSFFRPRSSSSSSSSAASHFTQRGAFLPPFFSPREEDLATPFPPPFPSINRRGPRPTDRHAGDRVGGLGHQRWMMMTDSSRCVPSLPPSLYQRGIKLLTTAAVNNAGLLFLGSTLS